MTTDPITRLNAALEGRYRVEREIGEGGMAVVDAWTFAPPTYTYVQSLGCAACRLR